MSWLKGSLRTCRSSVTPTSCQWTAQVVLVADLHRPHPPVVLPVLVWAEPAAVWAGLGVEMPRLLQTVISGTTDSRRDDRPALQSTRGHKLTMMSYCQILCNVGLHSWLTIGTLVYSVWWKEVVVLLGLHFDRVDLIKLVSNVRPYVRAYIRTSVRPQKFLRFQWNLARIGRGRWVMHDGMQYDPIRDQGPGHESYKVGNLAIFKSYLFRHLQWELATGHWFLNHGAISTLILPDFLCLS